MTLTLNGLTQGRRRFSVWLVVLCTAVTLGSSLAARAQAQTKTGTAADMLPADAAFYGSTLRLGELYDIATGSKAWKKLKSIPTLQFGLSMASSQIEQTGAMQQLEALQIFPTLRELFGSEVFFYGDESSIDFVVMLQEMNGSRQFGKLGAQLEGQDPNTANARAFLDALAEDPERIAAPNILVGFKIKNKELIVSQIQRLEELLQGLLEEQPELKESLERTEIEDNEYLTFTLEGNMLPWDEIEPKIKELEEDEGDYDEVIESLKESEVVINLGIRDDYLLLSIGGDNELIEGLGEGEVLASRPEFKWLAPHLSKKLLSVQYVSDDAAKALGVSKEDFVELAEVGKQLLSMAELDEEAQEKIGEDIEELFNDLQPYIVPPGAIFGFQVMTANGTESFTYSAAVNPALDASKPLSILNHVGGAPILAVTGRGAYRPQDYDLLIKWIKRGYGYIDEFAVPQMPEEEQEKYKAFMADTAPLWQRLDSATGKMLIPALRDGQTAFVLDAKIGSKKWQAEMPESDRDLPMLEAAVVLGVSDPALLRKAVAEYRSVINAFIERARQEAPEEIAAGVQVPDPVKVDSKSGNVVKYPLPAEAQLDERLAPAAGMNDKFAALSTSPEQVSRVLEDQPIQAQSVLGKHKGPAAAAVYFDWAALVQTISPWVDYAMVQHMGGGDRENVEALLGQINTGLEVLQVLRTVESVTTVDDGVTVSHTQTVWKDVE